MQHPVIVTVEGKKYRELDADIIVKLSIVKAHHAKMLFFNDDIKSSLKEEGWYNYEPESGMVTIKSGDKFKFSFINTEREIESGYCGATVMLKEFQSLTYSKPSHNYSVRKSVPATAKAMYRTIAESFDYLAEVDDKVHELVQNVIDLPEAMYEGVKVALAEEVTKWKYGILPFAENTDYDDLMITKQANKNQPILDLRAKLVADGMDKYTPRDMWDLFDKFGIPACKTVKGFKKLLRADQIVEDIKYSVDFHFVTGKEAFDAFVDKSINQLEAQKQKLETFKKLDGTWKKETMKQYRKRRDVESRIEVLTNSINLKEADRAEITPVLNAYINNFIKLNNDKD